jgi:hypothetical protein
MKVIIKIDTEDGTKEMSFSTEGIDNLNFLNLAVEDKEYLISLDELIVVAIAFEKNRLLNDTTLPNDKEMF